MAEVNRRLRVPHGRLEQETMECLQARSKEEGRVMPEEELRNYSAIAAKLARANVSPLTLYRGMVIEATEIAWRLAMASKKYDSE
ncbi:MAG TPA: hypothetical protein VJ142_00095 [Candidatus Nanoarchaeia archaeon]|nr:hypothetical protein [Candidatus Nanoarchaeia archaeon]